MTPLLVLGFGQPPAVAVGTDLLFSATTKLAATASSGFSRRVDWRIVGRLALGSVPACTAVLAWLWMSHRTPLALDAVVSRCLSVILAVAALALLLQPWLRRLGLSITAAWLDRTQRHKLSFTVAAGALLGAGVGLTSVGAGALGVVAILALYPLRLTPERLVATDIAHALPMTAIAAAGHALLGTPRSACARVPAGGLDSGNIARIAAHHPPARRVHAHAHRRHARGGQRALAVCRLSEPRQAGPRQAGPRRRARRVSPRAGRTRASSRRSAHPRRGPPRPASASCANRRWRDSPSPTSGW
jgi:uncharacterized membrane protein YfcA